MNLFENIKSIFQRNNEPLAKELTRAQARKLIFTAIDPLLEEEGFTYKKGNNVWRISDDKTDVIELRFLTTQERRSMNVPQSTFSILYGCFFHFIPNSHDDQIFKIKGLITPLEVYCHFRGEAKPSLKQKRLAPFSDVWYLDVDEKDQFIIFKDVNKQLQNEIISILNRYTNIRKWIEYLESKDNTIDIGGPESFRRNFLRGFTFKHINDIDKAIYFLNKAKIFVDERNEEDKEIFKDLAPDAPVFKEQQIINQALNDLETITR